MSKKVPASTSTYKSLDYSKWGDLNTDSESEDEGTTKVNSAPTRINTTKNIASDAGEKYNLNASDVVKNVINGVVDNFYDCLMVQDTYPAANMEKVFGVEYTQNSYKTGCTPELCNMHLGSLVFNCWKSLFLYEFTNKDKLKEACKKGTLPQHFKEGCETISTRYTEEIKNRNCWDMINWDVVLLKRMSGVEPTPEELAKWGTKQQTEKLEN